MADDKNNQIHNVTSYNQSGGVTAHTVNIGPQRRKMDDALRNQILTQLPRDKEISVTAVMGDGEALEFALEINAFLHANGFKVPSATGISQAVFVGSVPPLQFDPTQNSLVVGSNR